MSDSSAQRSMREFSSGVPVTARVKGAPRRRTATCVLAWRFLTNCASSRTTPPHSIGVERRVVEAKHGIRGDDDLGIRDRPSVSGRPTLALVAVTATTCRCGAKVSSSPSQVPTTLVGATTRTGPRPSATDTAAELAPVMRAGEGGDDLQRLAETHVVGEDAADPGVPQPGEPAVARRAGRAAAWRAGRAAPRRAAQRDLERPSASTLAAHRALCWSTTPRATSSSQRSAWCGDRRSPPDSGSAISRASSMSSRSRRSSGRSRRNQAPESRSMISSPRASAAKSGSKGTSSPSTSTETAGRTSHPAHGPAERHPRGRAWPSPRRRCRAGRGALT